MYLFESILAAILPMLTYLYIIWKNDKFEPEPIRLVLKSFFYGALGAIAVTLVFASIASGLLSILFNTKTITLLDAILIAPVIEEIAKGMFLFTLAKNLNFDNITDGLVYGGAIGLGFGMTENFMYFFAQDTSLYSWVMVVILRTFFSAVMHCIATATVGAFIAISKFSINGNKKIFPLIGFFIAMIIHFLWNFNLSYDNTIIYAFIIMILIIVCFIVIFRLSLKKEKELITDELNKEAIEGFFPENQVLLIATTKNHSMINLPEHLKENFIKAATKLAFRKVQFRNSLDEQKELYEKEIIKYRDIIKETIRVVKDE